MTRAEGNFDLIGLMALQAVACSKRHKTTFLRELTLTILLLVEGHHVS